MTTIFLEKKITTHATYQPKLKKTSRYWSVLVTPIFGTLSKPWINHFCWHTTKHTPRTREVTLHSTPHNTWLRNEKIRQLDISQSDQLLTACEYHRSAFRMRVMCTVRVTEYVMTSIRRLTQRLTQSNISKTIII